MIAVLRTLTAVDRLRDTLNALVVFGPVEVVWKPWKPRRSDQQNRALWGVAYKTLADATGNDPDDLHTYFLGEWAGWQTVNVMGQARRLPKRRSSKLNKAEFAEFYAFIQRRAAEAGYYVPDPGEL